MADELLKLILAGMEKEESRAEREITRSLSLLESAAARKHDRMMQDDRQEHELATLSSQQKFEQSQAWIAHERSKALQEFMVDLQREKPSVQDAALIKEERSKALLEMEQEATMSLNSILSPFVNSQNFTDLEEGEWKKIVDNWTEVFEDLEGDDALRGEKWLSSFISAKAGDTSALHHLMSELAERQVVLTGFDTEKGKLEPGDAVTFNRHQKYIEAIQSLGLFGDSQTFDKTFAQTMQNVNAVTSILDQINKEQTELRIASIEDIMTKSAIGKAGIEVSDIDALPEIQRSDIWKAIEIDELNKLKQLNRSLLEKTEDDSGSDPWTYKDPTTAKQAEAMFGLAKVAYQKDKVRADSKAKALSSAMRSNPIAQKFIKQDWGPDLYPGMEGKGLWGGDQIRKDQMSKWVTTPGKIDAVKGMVRKWAKTQYRHAPDEMVNHMKEFNRIIDDAIDMSTAYQKEVESKKMYDKTAKTYQDWIMGW